MKKGFSFALKIYAFLIILMAILGLWSFLIYFLLLDFTLYYWITATAVIFINYIIKRLNQK